MAIYDSPAETPAGARRWRPDRATISVHGVLGEGGVQRLRSQVNGLLVSGARHLVIDLSAVPRCDSVLARELGWVRARLREYGGSLTVTLAGHELDAVDLPLNVPLHERVPAPRQPESPYRAGHYRPETADQP
jgi:hypothetical protein